MRASTMLMLVGAQMATALLAGGFGAATPRRAPVLRAGGGPPPYDKIGATLVANDVVGRAARLLRLESDQEVAYEPGHVLALEVERDGEWLRGPYTVTRATARTFDVLVRVCGEKSETMAAAAVGSRFRFGGKFHVPILEGVASDAANVCCLSTGTGVGPVLGFCEQALATTALDVTVFSGYRAAEDVCCRTTVARLRDDYAGRVAFSDALSSTAGRVTGPAAVAAVAAAASPATHFHLIGNGGMVNEWRAGLARAGVPDARVTTETYFNHKAEPDDAAVDRIAAALSAAAAAPVPA